MFVFPKQKAADAAAAQKKLAEIAQASLDLPSLSLWLYDPAADELVRQVSRGDQLAIPSRLPADRESA